MEGRRESIRKQLLEFLKNRGYSELKEEALACSLWQCFLTAGPRPGTGPWHQLYQAARDSPAICHFSSLSNFNEEMFYSGNILRRKIFVNVSKNSDPDVGLRKLQYATRFH